MKTEKELNQDILKITATMTESFPEIVKYISEIPVKISYVGREDINIKQLTEYYNSLETMFIRYSNNHKKLKN